MESMNHSIIRYILCRVIELTGVLLLLPVLVSVFYREKQGFVFLFVALCCLLAGNIGKRMKPKSTVFYAREGFVTVSLSWIVISMIGALPFFLTGEISSYVDALFETVSGLTTTGGTILNDVETLSYTTQFTAVLYALDRRYGSACADHGHSPAVRQLQYASDEGGKSGPFRRQAGAEGKDDGDDSIRDLYCDHVLCHYSALPFGTAAL